MQVSAVLRHPVARAVACALLLLPAVILLACGAAGAPPAGTGSPPAQTTASPPTAATSAAPWDYVVIGDSAFAAPDMFTVADTQAELIARDQGADVAVDWFYYPGSTSGLVLDKLRHDERLRQAVRGAEVVLFDVPVGQLKQEIPWDDEAYTALPGSPARYRKGMARMLPRYRADAEAIVAEITALRSPSAASIRVIDVWQLGAPGFRELGVGEVMRAAWMRMNAAVDQAAAAHGVTVIDAYSAFMGADGRDDPVAAGWVLPDQQHLTARGIDKLAELLHAAGYDELAPPQ